MHNTYELMDRRAVEALLGVGTSTLYDWMAAGMFPRPMKLGSLARWKRSTVETWIEDQAREAATSDLAGQIRDACEAADVLEGEAA